MVRVGKGDKGKALDFPEDYRLDSSLLGSLESDLVFEQLHAGNQLQG